MGRINRAIQRIKRNKRAPMIYFLNRGTVSRVLSDKAWISLMWKAKLGTSLNLHNPTGFNEKLQWLSLNYRPAVYTKMVDKYAARQIVAQRIGDEYLVPLLGHWENASLIDFEALPNEFVLKCNHNSGEGMCICKDKHNLDIEKTIINLNATLKRNYYWTSREWTYKNVQPSIIAEEFLRDPKTGNKGLIDYKFYCFNGEPKFFYIGYANIINGIKHDQLSFMDIDWKKVPFYRKDHDQFPFETTKPSNWDKMVEIARALSDGLPFVRIDLYNISGKIYFSEFTLYPGGGYGKFYPDEWEKTLGDWIDLSLIQENGRG